MISVCSVRNKEFLWIDLIVHVPPTYYMMLDMSEMLDNSAYNMTLQKPKPSDFTALRNLSVGLTQKSDMA